MDLWRRMKSLRPTTEEKNVTDQTNPLAHLLGLANLITPMAIRVAATLRIPDLVKQGNDTLPTLARESKADPHALGALVDLLIELAILTNDQDGKLTLTELGSALTDDEGPFRTMLDLNEFAGRYDLAATEMLHTVVTGTPGFEHKYGLTYWDDVARNPQMAQTVGALQPDSPMFNAELLLDAVDWSTSKQMIDVGGSNGAVLSYILSAHPHLYGIVFDLPGFTNNALETLAKTGMQERSSASGGNFFEAVPEGFDTYLVNAVIYDWDDSRATRILSNVRQAAGLRTRVIISEVTMRDENAPRNPSLDLQMLATASGRERTIPEVIDLARVAGMKHVGTPQRRGQRFVVEFETV